MEKDKLKKHSVYLAFGIVFIMCVIKFIAFLFSNSVSILASLIDSLADLFTSIITGISVLTGLKPADKKHSFGYGKAESIGALFQAIMLFLSAFFLIVQGVKRLVIHQVIHIDNISLFIMVVCMILTIVLVIFQRKVIKATESIAIKADSLNYTTDIFTTLGVIISLLLTKYLGIGSIDAIFGIVIALFLVKNAKSVLVEALKILMDTQISEDKQKKIIKEIEKNKDILGYHDFKTRYCGQKYFVELHIELDKKLSFVEAHEISRNLKKKITDKFENMNLIIHQDVHGHAKK